MPMTGGWDRLTPEGEKFFRQIDELQDKEVFVGFQAGKVTDDRGVDMAQIAMWNELGTSTAPSRPFLRKSVDENADPMDSLGTPLLLGVKMVPQFPLNLLFGRDDMPSGIFAVLTEKESVGRQDFADGTARFVFVPA
jgi:hypothetical protein